MRARQGEGCVEELGVTLGDKCDKMVHTRTGLVCDPKQVVENGPVGSLSKGVFMAVLLEIF